MRGSRTKKIRREIYGDLSLKNKKYYRDSKGVIHADELRAAYQKAKKERDHV